MEKKTINVHAVTIHAYMIAIVLLIVALLALGVKYVHLKFSLNNFMLSTMQMNDMQMHQPVSNVTDYGVIIATTVPQYTTTSSDGLQGYIAKLSSELKRDIVVVDSNEKILADTIAANRGSQYGYDKDGEVKSTMKDGISRSFVETSPDYPNGISEVVVPVKNASNEITGAVIISNFQVAK